MSAIHIGLVRSSRADGRGAHGLRCRKEAWVGEPGVCVLALFMSVTAIGRGLLCVSASAQDTTGTGCFPQRGDAIGWEEVKDWRLLVN